METGPEEENVKSGSGFVCGQFSIFFKFLAPRKSLGIGWSDIEENVFHGIKSGCLELRLTCIPCSAPKLIVVLQ